MLFKRNDLALQKLSMIIIASVVFVMIVHRPHNNEYIIPLRLWKDGYFSTSQPVPYNPYPDYNSAAWKRNQVCDWSKIVEGVNASREAPFLPPTPTTEMGPSSWGVGEEADVITWLPQFNPADMGWPMRDVIYEFTEGSDTPRRASPVAMSRFSARVLRFMHADMTEKGLGLDSEMSPTS
ncbi:hypothetical protein AAEP93_009910 [Penicillium crustosum]